MTPGRLFAGVANTAAGKAVLKVDANSSASRFSGSDAGQVRRLIIVLLLLGLVVPHQLVWEPPERLVLAWRIGPDWRYDPELTTEVEVRFLADGEGTMVELEHRLDGYGPDAEDMRRLFEGPLAWAGVLDEFAGFLSRRAGEGTHGAEGQ